MISIVVPCYNEEEVLPELRERITEASGAWGTPFEIIAVDDGSTDATWDRLQEIAARDPQWKVIRFG